MIGIDTTMDIPLSGDLRSLIVEAAALRGQSVNEFVIETLEETSRRVVQEHGTTILSDRDRDIFLAMLDADAIPETTAWKAWGEHRREADRLWGEIVQK